MYVTFNRCWQLNFLRQHICADFSITTDFLVYGYTSYENLTRFADDLNNYKILFDYPGICGLITAYFICNVAFVPCNVFTGAPRPICTDSCYYFRTECENVYNALLGVTISLDPDYKDNCNNTFNNLQITYDFPCSSDSLAYDCIDLIGR